MGSFIMRCSETKSVLSEGKSSTIVFISRKVNQNIKRQQPYLGEPKPLLVVKSKAKDYGEFGISDKELDKVLNFFKNTDILETQYTYTLYDGWSKFSNLDQKGLLKEFWEENKNCDAEKATPTFEEYSDIRDYLAHSIVKGVKENPKLTQAQKHKAFNGILYNSFERFFFIKCQNEIYQITAAVYSTLLINKLKDRTIWNKKLQEVNLEQYIQGFFAETNSRHEINEVNSVWKSLFIDHIGTSLAYLNTKDTNGDIVEYMNSIKSKDVTIVENKIRKALKDFFLFSFFFEMGLSTEYIISGGQDYRDDEAKKMHNQMTKAIV